MKISALSISAVATFALAAFARADVTLPAVISDNMVLQKTKANIWGKADPKEQVTVKIAGKSANATAGDDGKWLVKLDLAKAGAGPHEMTISGKNTITIKNVAIGEVWVASGQSNMEFHVGKKGDALHAVKNVEEETEKANFPMIRMFTVARKVSAEPLEDVQGKWEVCTPETVSSFSAVAYFFARDIHQKTKQPVGVIHTSWGGTPAESWTPKTALEADPELKSVYERWQKTMDAYPKLKEEYDKKMAEWKEQAEQAKAEGKKPGPAPRPPRGPGDAWNPSSLYNAMIAPITQYTIRGAIWYQGESNADRAAEYRKLFPTMIESWRKAWGYPFPFGFVQLANYMAKHDEPTDSKWAELREAQTMTLKLPKTGMAVIIDAGEEKDIHPKDKQTVGHRLALWALANVYDLGGTYSGPMFSSMKISGNKAILTFKSTGGGLIAKGGEPLKGFAIAGEDQKFTWAEAKIGAKGTVTVSSPQVPKPVAVRYDWADNPDGNLYNKEGLPACPFRTDSWEKTMALVVPVAKPAEVKSEKPAENKAPISSEKSAKETEKK